MALPLKIPLNQCIAMKSDAILLKFGCQTICEVLSSIIEVKIDSEKN